MLIDHQPLWAAQTNCYVVAPERGGPCVVVDVPPDVSGLLALLAKHDLTPVALLITHGHIDHVGGAGSAAQTLQAGAYVHPDDDFLTLDPSTQLRMLFGGIPPGDFSPLDSYKKLQHGQVLELAGLAFEVRHTPGHTPGHCCFYVSADGVLFSGDQLFAGSIGRTDLPGGDFDTLMRSMADQVLTLPDEVIVHPGHGPATTLAAERRFNPFLQGI